MTQIFSFTSIVRKLLTLMLSIQRIPHAIHGYCMEFGHRVTFLY